jgi:hypothetical protein
MDEKDDLWKNVGPVFTQVLPSWCQQTTTTNHKLGLKQTRDLRMEPCGKIGEIVWPTTYSNTKDMIIINKNIKNLR